MRRDRGGLLPGREGGGRDSASAEKLLAYENSVSEMAATDKKKEVRANIWESPKSPSLGLNREMVVLNQGTEDEVEVWGYQKNSTKLAVTLLAVLLSGGMLGLLLYWVERYWLYCTANQSSLKDANFVLVVDRYKEKYKSFYVKEIKVVNHNQSDIILPLQYSPEYKSVNEVRYLNLKKMKYIWDEETSSFYACAGLDRNISLQKLHAYSKGLTEDESSMRRNLYGENEIKVPLHSIPVLLIKEILSPFYVFQVFSVCFWYADDYWMYASTIVLTSALGIGAALYNTRRTQRNLRDTIVSSETVNVFRPDGSVVRLMSTDLVPGDLIEVPDHGCQMHCDAVLVEGQAIMNESMLTGESVPVTKTACASDETIYANKEHEVHTLRCGTQVIQTRKFKGQTVKAVVIRTGFLTTKGDLVRSILYPPPVDFKFEKDSYKFITVLAAIAFTGMAYTLVKMVNDEESVSDIILEVFDLITIVVPPALPAAMTIGIVIAQQRLRKLGIFCISPRSINIAGTINCVCFDKTGTITEDGMDMWGIIPAKVGLESAITAEVDAGSPQFCEPRRVVSDLEVDSRMLIGMAVCHELNVISGQIMGDPLDEKIFESTSWTLELGGEEQSQVDQLVMPFVKSPMYKSKCLLQAAPHKIMHFKSDTQCMSVVCRVFQEQLEGGFTAPQCLVYCKGSPEKIGRICRPETVPADYAAVLDHYASSGYRIIGLAYKSIPANMSKTGRINKMTREEVETDLIFLGLIVLENRIKPVSSAVFKELHGANIRPVMVTGDNILTAVSVSRNCGLLPAAEKLIHVTASMENDKPSVEYRLLSDKKPDKETVADKKVDIDGGSYQFVLDGTTFDVISTYYKSDLLPLIVRRGAVFARMRPDMKQALVETLQELGYLVGMCGDGANDCGALKAANAGISLSEAEASVASPFTSKTPDISCVPRLIQESRAALVTSFGIFKYMAAYSLTQFVSVMILYEIYSNLSDAQFLFVDLFIITTLATMFGLNPSYSGPLASRPPEKSLISFRPLFSLLSQLVIVISFQLAALFFTKSQDWFVEFDYDSPCYIGTIAEVEFNNSGLLDLDKCDPAEDPVASYENYSVFSVSQFQYIILAIVFAKGAPYRKSIFHNFPIMIDIAVLCAFCIYLVLDPAPIFISGFIVGFELFLPPDSDFRFRLILLGLVGANCLVCLLWEAVVTDVIVTKVTKHKQQVYDHIEDQLEDRKDWPPLSEGSAPPRSFSAKELTAEGDVVITGQGVSNPNDAFDSLFSTPASISHSSAAIYLNPPPYTPSKDAQEINLKSSVESTPKKSFNSALSTPGSEESSASESKFVSCDSVVVDRGVENPAPEGSGTCSVGYR